VVCDVDVKPDRNGDITAAQRGYDFGTTLMAHSGGGGRHYFYNHPGSQVKSVTGTEKVGLGPGLDSKAGGGYIVAAPSRHVSGKEYQWAADPRAKQPAPCPPWLLDGLTTKSRSVRQRQETCDGDIIPEGSRDDTLISIAGTLRQRDHLGEDEIYSQLSEVNASRCQPPLSDSEVRRIAKSAATYKILLRGFPQTDSGAGELFAFLYRDKFRYDHNRGLWLSYDGRIWNAERGGPAARRHALKTARALRSEALELTGSEREALERFARQLEASGKIDNLLKEARCNRTIESYAADFDKQPMLLNCLNGTIDLETGKLRRHDPADMLTKMCPVEYDPDAKFRLWDEFLDKCTEGERELKRFLQRAVGYSITGYATEEVLFLIHGGTATDKSTFLQAVLSALGDYAMTANFTTFLRDASLNRIRVDLAHMVGKRMIISSEVDEGKALAEGPAIPQGFTLGHGGHGFTAFWRGGQLRMGSERSLRTGINGRPAAAGTHSTGTGLHQGRQTVTLARGPAASRVPPSPVALRGAC
jgi:putative DNA primase/helicase